MKNLVFKTFAILVLSFFINNQSYGQMIPCTPTIINPNPCGTACMEITVVNNTNCPLSLYWGYSKCAQLIGYSTPVLPGTSVTKTGPCAECPDQSGCECPNKIMVMDNTNTLFWPWGDITTMFPNGDSKYTNVQNICSGCPGGVVKIEVFIISTTKATIVFSC